MDDLKEITTKSPGENQSPGEPQVPNPLLHSPNQNGKEKDGAKNQHQLPRGCRFPSLNEAHRNITGRSLSNGEMSNHSTSNTSSPQKENKAPASQPQGVLRSKKEGTAGQSESEDAIDRAIRQISNPPTPTPKSVKRGMAIASSTPTPMSKAAKRGMAIEPASPMSKAAKRGMAIAPYITSDFSYNQLKIDHANPAALATPEPTPALDLFPDSPTDNNDNEDANATSGDDADEIKNGGEDCDEDLTMCRPTSGIITVYTAAHGNGFDMDAMASEHVAVRSIIMATTPTRESILYPEPLRVQSMRPGETATQNVGTKNGQKHLSVLSNIAPTNTDMTSDTDDDPFKYDRDPFKLYLHPSKEREVSAALIHASGISAHSKATLHEQEELDSLPTPKNPYSKAPSSVPAQSVTSGPSRVLHAGARMPVSPANNSGFYDSSIVQPNWIEKEDGQYEVKVVLQDVNQNQTPARCLTVTDDKRQASRNALTQKNLYRVAERENKDVQSSERDEWETVVTTGPSFVPSTRPTPRGFPFLLAGTEQLGKTTGDSIADVSDESTYGRSYDQFVSGDRMMNRPRGQDESEESLQMRNVSGTRFPVIVPKQRVHRVNGRVQDSTPAVRPMFNAAGSQTRRQSNPFRQMGVRQGRAVPAPLILQPTTPRNRYEFRMSQDTDYDALYEQAFCDSPELDSTRGVEGSMYPSTDGEGSRGAQQRGALPSLNSGGTVHSFGFQLIPLSEAQQRQASLQVTGGPDETKALPPSPSSGGTVHSFGFPLIPLPEAQRRAASLRVSGHAADDDGGGLQYRTANARRPSQTFAGNAGLRTPSRTHNRKPRNFLLPTPANRVGLTKSGTAFTAISSTTGGGTWATIPPIPEDATSDVEQKKSFFAKLNLVALFEKLKPQSAMHMPVFSLGGNAPSVAHDRNAPHLYPWDYPQQLRRWQQQEQYEMQNLRSPQSLRSSPHRTRVTDPELRAIAGSNMSGRGSRRYPTPYPSPYPASFMSPYPSPYDAPHDLERMAVPIPMDPDAFLSHAARNRRRLWFLCLLFISAFFPFFSALVYAGKLNAGLSWFTRGEVDRLSLRQRKIIMVVGVLQMAIWPCVIVGIIWHVQGTFS